MKRLIFIIVSILMCINYALVYGQVDQERMERLEQNIDTLKLKVDTLETGVDSIIGLLQTMDKYFNVSIGARYSFVSEPKPTNLYYDIVGFIPSIWPDTTEKNFCNKNRIGVYAALNETYFKPDKIKLDSAQVVGTTLYINEPTTVIEVSESSSLLVRNSYYRSFKAISQNSIGLTIRPSYKITKNMYALFHAEFIYSAIEIKFTDELIDTDTISIPTDNIPANLNAWFPYERSTGYTLHDYRTLFGVDLFVAFESKDIVFRFIPGCGWAHNIQHYNTYNGKRVKHSSCYPYITGHFSLIELKSGVKIAGDIWSFPKNNQLNYSIYLSKQFKLGKLADLF